MLVQYLLYTIKSRLADSKRGAKVLPVFEVQLLHLIKHVEGETVDPGKYANLSGGCELVELVDISRTGRRREADGLRRAPLRRAVGRRVTAVGRADKQHDDERREHHGLAQAA